MLNKWQHSGNWFIRKPDGEAVNLNSSQGADYVLGLLQELAEAQGKPRRGKPGPSENKGEQDDQ